MAGLAIAQFELWRSKEVAEQAKLVKEFMEDHIAQNLKAYRSMFNNPREAKLKARQLARKVFPNRNEFLEEVVAICGAEEDLQLRKVIGEWQTNLSTLIGTCIIRKNLSMLIVKNVCA